MKKAWKIRANKKYEVSYLDYDKNEIKKETIQAIDDNEAYSIATPIAEKIGAAYIIAKEK